MNISQLPKYLQRSYFKFFFSLYIQLSHFSCLLLFNNIMVKGRPCALLMISLVFIIQCSTSAFANSHSSSMRMELIHRHALYLNTRPKTQLELMKDLFHSDIIRQKMIAHKRRLSLSPIRDALETTNTSSTAIEMPLRAGRDCGTGVYFVQMKVGTPAQKFTLVVDTGSELTWVSCRYKCGADCTTKGRLDKRRVFKADFSSSFKTVACFSHMCKIELMNLFSLTRCPMPSNPCAYDFRYLHFLNFHNQDFDFQIAS